MQMVTGCVVSGSVIPSVLHHNVTFQPNDIDLYVPFDKAWEVVQYILHSADYAIDLTNDDYDAVLGIACLWMLRMGPFCINIMESHTVSARDIVLHHHSSAVMGTLCAKKTWLAYPEMSNDKFSLATRQSLPLANTEDATRWVWKLLRKYAKRGFTFVFRYEKLHECGRHPSCLITVHTNVDGGCLNMYLPDHPFEFESEHEMLWMIGNVVCGHDKEAEDTKSVIKPATSYADGKWRNMVGRLLLSTEDPYKNNEAEQQ
ncbi:hypothetical protein B0H17DRAFT_1198256 [Mycena rosella]|uniref:Uncharacterized protein n=1 Tax=Mycena rosella TaxID=1033263 RepID=A0AAD7DP08_MYCRO|nr:hypothetical protein B0H17DRAFT_1198256 [Mycena rosella]